MFYYSHQTRGPQMKIMVIDSEFGRLQPGGAYLKVENDRLFLGVWSSTQENVMVLSPRDIAGIRAFLNGVTAHAVDGAPLPRPWHVSGNVQETHDHE